MFVLFYSVPIVDAATFLFFNERKKDLDLGGGEVERILDELRELELFLEFIVWRKSIFNNQINDNNKENHKFLKIRQNMTT